ncbi:hypothetical protein FRC11_003491, partial [Ceratobasidium sp. 423]
RTVIDEYYGERVGVGVEEDICALDEGEDTRDEGNESTSDMDDDSSDVLRIEAEGSAIQSQYRYPRPGIKLARQPTISSVPGRVLVVSYRAADLFRVLRRFLQPKACVRGKELILLPSDEFDVWHKATLSHLPGCAFPNSPPHRDVIRAHPPERDSQSRVRKYGDFDTALFAADGNLAGLPRFRAGRIRAIFTLPQRLQVLHSGPLMYIEVFTPFKPDATRTHHLYSTSPAYSDSHHAALILPLNALVLGCHLTPDFSHTPVLLPGPHTPERFTCDQHLLFNEFYNHFTYSLLARWHYLEQAT